MPSIVMGYHNLRFWVIATENELANPVILYRKPKLVKFDRNFIVSSKFTYKNKVLNNIGSDKYIMKVQRFTYPLLKIKFLI